MEIIINHGNNYVVRKRIANKPTPPQSFYYQRFTKRNLRLIFGEFSD